MTIDTAATRKQVDLYPKPYLAIAGERRSGEGRETRQVVNPSTGETLAHIPLATASDLQDALASTRTGFDVWSKMTAYERAELLHTAAQWMREHRDEGARRISLELGKPTAEARTEIHLSASLIEWAADEALRAYGRVIPSRRPGLHLEARLKPVGPVYAVASWNAPANTPARKLSGSLAAGCSIILKLSDQVPATGLFLYEAFEAAGLPTGVVQMITGKGADVSNAMVPSDAIRMVTLTGSVELGRTLASQAAQHLKPQTMELGGHAPAIVHNDVDVVRVARGAARAKFRNAGQICIAPTRFMVHDDVYEQFLGEFVAETERMVIGDPFAEGTNIGPMQSEKHLGHIEELIADAVGRGATIATGGRRLSEEGFFFAPAVVTSVPQDSQVRTIEPFGPIALVDRYTDVADAVERGNSLAVGLAAYGFTSSGKTAHYLASNLQSGNIILNNWNASFPETPFGGIGDSGYGREGGVEGLRDFLTTVLVSNEF